MVLVLKFGVYLNFNQEKN